MKKLLCAAILAVFLFSSLFAFSSKSVGLTNSDVESFINNYSEINKLLDEKLNFETDANVETLSLAEIMALIPSDINKSVSKELNKLGISGSNAVAKTFAITYGVAYSYMKTMYELIKLFAEEGDDSLAEIDASIANYESFLSEADYSVIENNIDGLYSALGFGSDGGYSDSDWDNYDWGDYDEEYGYEWGDDDYEYDWGDYDWSDYDWGDEDYEYDWDDYDWSDYDWGDEDYEYDWDDYDYSEEDELDSETGVAFLKELIPSLSARSGSSEFLYKTIKPGTYKKITETDNNAFMFQKKWAGSKYPELSVSDFCISIEYKDPSDPDVTWDDMVYKYFYIDGTTELYKATIRGTNYYERVIKTKQYGTIRIWVDGTNFGEGEEAYYSSNIYAVLSIGDYIIEGTAFVPAG